MDKELEYYMKMHYPAIISGSLDEGYHATLVDIPACSATGETLQKLMKNLNMAKKRWIQNAIATGAEIPEPRVRKTNI
mgnify:CR=1 FL=1